MEIQRKWGISQPGSNIVSYFGEQIISGMEGIDRWLNGKTSNETNGL